MTNSSLSGLKKNTTLDYGAWGIIALLLGGIPLLVSLFRTPPEVGPVGDPSILIMFLILLAGTLGFAVWLIVLMVQGRAHSLADRTALSPQALNTVNIMSKLMGALFIVSGFVKLQDITGFSYKLDDYWAVFAEYVSFFPGEFFKSLSIPMAWFVSVFEVMLAFALMTGYRMKIAAWPLLLMIAFFTFLTGFSAITGEVTDCGCFGDALKLTPFQSFMKDVGLMFAVVPLFMLRKRIHPYYHNPIPATLTYGSFVLLGFFSYYSYQHLPPFDFRGAYTVGQDLEYNASNFDHEGQIIAHDFSDFCGDCGGKAYQGAALYVVMYNMDKSDKADRDAAAALQIELREKAPGIKFCPGTNTGGKVRRSLEGGLPADQCYSLQDEKVLKTIVRSSPGYVLVKDGIVMKKWHANDIPDAAELKELVPEYADLQPLPPEPEPIAVPDSLLPDSLRTDSMANDS